MFYKIKLNKYKFSISPALNRKSKKEYGMHIRVKFTCVHKVHICLYVHIYKNLISKKSRKNER